MGVLAIITYPVGVPMLLLALCYIYRVPFYAKRKMDDHWLRAARSRSRRRNATARRTALSRSRPSPRVAQIIELARHRNIELPPLGDARTLGVSTVSAEVVATLHRVRSAVCPFACLALAAALSHEPSRRAAPRRSC